MGKKISARSTPALGACAAPAAPTPIGPATHRGLFTVSNVAADLGVPVEAISALLVSHCTTAVHFTEVRGTIVFTAAGVAHVRLAVAESMRNDAAPSTVAETAAPGTEPAGLTEDLQITRVFPWAAAKKTTSLNVLAERPNGNEVVLVVKDVTHLEAGMVLAGCVKGTHAWYYMGRLPRAVGQRQLFFPPVSPAQKPRRGSST